MWKACSLSKRSFSTVDFSMLLLLEGHVISGRCVQQAKEEAAWNPESIIGLRGKLGSSSSLTLGLRLLRCRRLWIFLLESQLVLSIPRTQHTVILVTRKQQRMTHWVLEAFILEIAFKWQWLCSEARGEGSCQRRKNGKIAHGLQNGKDKLCVWSVDRC